MPTPSSPSPPGSGPSIGQAVVLFLAGLMLLATTCFGIFGLERSVPTDLQPLVFFAPLLFVAAGVVVSLVAFFAGLVRRFTRTERTATGPQAAGEPPVAVEAAPPVAVETVPPLAVETAPPLGRPTFVQGLGIATAGCVLFLSLCAGIGGSSGGRAGWIAGPILLVLIGAALYGFGVMVLRVIQAFGPRQR